MANFDLVRLALKATCPGNDILLDDKGLPSIMVRVPKFKVSDVIAGGSSATHPAFIINGTEVPEIYLSKFQNVVYNGRGYSLPGETPATGMTFDNARTYCEAKGQGWHLMTNAEWAALALWCRKNNLMPKGNNNYGRDTTETTDVAIPATLETGTGRTLTVKTGTGPVTWSHNGDVTGIWDLNGNIYEWQGGYRTFDGEIQILSNNDAASTLNSQSASSTAWKAIMPDGTLVTPGTTGTLKWDYATAVPVGGTSSYSFRLNTSLVNQADNDSAYGSIGFASLTAASGVDVPEILKSLALFPADTGDHGGDSINMRNRGGERLGSRGGNCISTSSAGVFCMYGYGGPRSRSASSIGFRSAFVNL